MKKSLTKLLSVPALTATVLSASVAQAEVETVISGLIRQEVAYKLDSDESIFNQTGNVFNGRSVVNSIGSTITRPEFEGAGDDWNLFATRLELDIETIWSSKVTTFVKIRGFYDAAGSVDDDFGDANYFEVPLHGGSRGSLLEASGERSMIDLPSFYLDYNDGPLWVRVGNQQIAWGEALFFRISDVPNGLDLRRHSFIDFAAEEYADERVASPGIRGSYRFNDQWELEAFAQMFSPTIYGNENTPYNVISSQFVIQQQQGFDDAKDDVNTGLRLKANFGDLEASVFWVKRTNPDGVFRWTESNINPFAGIPGLDPVGALISQTPFELDVQGVHTGEEWFYYAAASRLNGKTGLNSSITEFAASQALGAAAQETAAGAALLLDVFFDPAGAAFGGGLGPLRGHLAREYKREDIYGFTANYVTTAAPDSFFDQMVIRAEATFTPDKVFTAPSLSRDFIVEDEFAASLVVEKYHRFSQSFPATFMVFEYMHRSEADLFGRHLSGNGSDGSIVEPEGSSSFNAFVFAMQQPFPNLRWRIDLSVLYDVEGGWLIQPGVRWKPKSEWTVEAFVNILESDGGNDDIIETIENADEFGLRVGYQF